MAEQRSASTPQQSKTKTEGAIKAGGGRYTFDLAKLSTIDAGPGYSTAHGPVIEGERIQVGLMRVPRGTGGRGTGKATPETPAPPKNLIPPLLLKKKTK